MSQAKEIDNSQSDLIVSYKLETEFFSDHVRHTTYVREARNRNEKMKEDWSDCEELGKGGFGIVHKQIEKTTGRYRAVKTIDKGLSRKHDYSRELLVMAILAKVRILARDLPHFTTPTRYYCRCLMLSGFSIHPYLSSSWDGSRSLRLCILQWNI